MLATFRLTDVAGAGVSRGSSVDQADVRNSPDVKRRVSAAKVASRHIIDATDFADGAGASVPEPFTDCHLTGL